MVLVLKWTRLQGLHSGGILALPNPSSEGQQVPRNAPQERLGRPVYVVAHYSAAASS